MLRFARQHAAAAPAFPPQYVAAQAERLPFADNAFDGLVATSLLGCLSVPHGFFAEVRRVLQPSGVAVMTFTNRASLLLRFNYLLLAATQHKTPATSEHGYRAFVSREAIRGLEAHGFSVLRVRFYNYVLHAGRWLFPPPALAARCERLGGYPVAARLARNFLVVAQKMMDR
jgi:ubiquinone/menaquinone biosynthesis C-methylase UbiE